MNYLDIIFITTLAIFVGTASIAIGFGLGRRSAYWEVNQNLGYPKHSRSLVARTK